MVFIVKIPSRGSGTKRDAQEEQGAPPAPVTQQAAPQVAPPVAAPLASPPAEPDVPATPVATDFPARNTATLDVILAPSVLKHRYVRGVDHSAIVERPERIRAVLLGVSGALGVHNHHNVPLKAQDEGDELSARLEALSMSNVHLPLRVLRSTRALSLDNPSDALRRIHALASEPITYSTTSEYALGNPRGGALGETTHTAALSHLAQNSPSAPPGTKRPSQTSQSVSDASSSDGEGDERVHACEIPVDLSQGDMYLCGPHAQGLADTSDGGSREAICHCLGACTMAVDRVVAGAQDATFASTEVHPVPATQHNALAADVPQVACEAENVPARRAFVLARPPGHHCSGSVPSGFCWVNNVAVAAAHAHEVHGIDRVIVLDIDLHHGNGTQALVWRINAEATNVDNDRAARLHAMRRESRGRRKPTYEQLVADEQMVGKRALRMYYGSVHDIESYPCEDGDVEMVRNASVCLAGAHSQWIWNGTLRGRQRCLFTCKRAEGASRHPMTCEQISEAGLEQTNQCISITTKTRQSSMRCTRRNTCKSSTRRGASCRIRMHSRNARSLLFRAASMHARTSIPACSATASMCRQSSMRASLLTRHASRTKWQMESS